MRVVTLRGLIAEVQHATGDSFQTIAERAQRRGESLTKSDVGDFAIGARKTLAPRKLTALAAGLDVPVYRVAVAFLAEHGIDVPVDARSPEDAIRHDPTLTPKARRTLLLLLDSERSGGEGSA